MVENIVSSSPQSIHQTNVYEAMNYSGNTATSRLFIRTRFRL
jgi:hypothetical protein